MEILYIFTEFFFSCPKIPSVSIFIQFIGVSDFNSIIYYVKCFYLHKPSFISHSPKLCPKELHVSMEYIVPMKHEMRFAYKFNFSIDMFDAHKSPVLDIVQTFVNLRWFCRITWVSLRYEYQYSLQKSTWHAFSLDLISG